MSSTVTRRSALTATIAVLAGGVVGVLYGRSTHPPDGPTTSGYGSVGEPAGESGGASGAASGGAAAGASPSAARTLLTPLSDVPVGGGLIKSGVVVTRPSGDAVHAFSSRCTHLGCTVNKVHSGKIFCPCHGSVFDATSGAVVDGPAPSPLPKIDVTVQNGKVYTS